MYRSLGIDHINSLLRQDEIEELGLQHLGLTASEAIEKVSQARGVEIPDTREQREFILSYQSLAFPGAR